MEDKASNLDAVLKEAVDLVRAPPFTTSPPLELTNLSSILSRAVTFVFEGGFGDRLVPVLLGSARLISAALLRRVLAFPSLGAGGLPPRSVDFWSAFSFGWRSRGEGVWFAGCCCLSVWWRTSTLSRRSYSRSISAGIP